MRVLVPLGDKKIYTGILYRPYAGEADPTIAYKEIISFLDDAPILTEQQLRLWEWMADYYMCSLGEVMKAALPAGLKLESETRVRVNPDFIAENPLSDTELRLLDAIPAKKAVSVEQLCRAVGLKSVVRQLNALMLLNAVFIEETVKESTIRRRKKKSVQDAAFDSPDTPKGSYPLNETQQAAYDSITEQWQKTPTVLLHGVTSSGKTEVYIHLIEEMIRQGRTALFLVPEIALTTQLTKRLRRVFGDRLGVYHSKFTDRQRVDIYRNVLRGDRYDVVIGVRSSLFLPFRNLGLVIVDEEHDASYKQQDPAPRYHGRSAAQVLASFVGAKVLLGTATPAIETYYNALTGKYGLVRMLTRYQGLSLPAIHLLDLKEQYRKKQVEGHFSDPLTFRIREQLQLGRQVMLFQNRRGYTSYLECDACGAVPKCVNCDVSLTEHKRTGRLECHYCGYSIPTPPTCPACGKGTLLDRGFGTEMLEEEVSRLFPEAHVARMDQDSTRSRQVYDRIIEDFSEHKVDILLGTQMITKGLHFRDVSLVAVMKADALLAQPDFRAAERAYQMLEQVAGRAGRAGTDGHVIIQTMQPDAPIYSYVQQHDYEAMYREQLKERELFHYPPFYRIISLTIRHREPSRLDTASRSLQEGLQRIFGTRCSAVIIPAVSRVQNLYVRHILLKIESTASYVTAKKLLREEIRKVQSLPACKGVLITPDVDPM